MIPVVKLFCVQLEEGKNMERKKKIALELSDLVIYCRPVPFDEDSKDVVRTCWAVITHAYRHVSLRSSSSLML